MTEGLQFSIENAVILYLLHHKHLFQRNGVDWWNQWHQFSFSINSPQLNEPQEFGP